MDQNLAVSIEIVGTSKIVKIGPDWRLTVLDGQEEPRISIADIAARVGHQAYKLREIARGMIDEFFNPLAISSERGVHNPSGFEELYLSERETLELCGHLRTPQAKAVTREVIRVYILARKGLLPAAKPASPLDTLRAMMASLEAQEAATEALKIEASKQSAALSEQAERVEALEHQAMVPATDGVDAYELAKTVGWYSEKGKPHGRAVLAACTNGKFTYDGRMYKRNVMIGKLLVSEWRISPTGVADFIRDLATSYHGDVFKVDGGRQGEFMVYRR